MWPTVGIDGCLLGFPLPQQPYNGLDQCRSILRIDQDADPLVGNGVATATPRSAHDFQPTGRRLEIDDAEAFLAARHDIKVGKTVEIGKVFLWHESQEAHGAGAPGKLESLPLQALAIVTGSRHDMDDCRKPGPQRRQGREYQLMPLVALAG